MGRSSQEFAERTDRIRTHVADQHPVIRGNEDLPGSQWKNDRIFDRAVRHELEVAESLACPGDDVGFTGIVVDNRFAAIVIDIPALITPWDRLERKNDCIAGQIIRIGRLFRVAGCVRLVRQRRRSATQEKRETPKPDDRVPIFHSPPRMSQSSTPTSLRTLMAKVTPIGEPDRRVVNLGEESSLPQHLRASARLSHSVIEVTSKDASSFATTKHKVATCPS